MPMHNLGSDIGAGKDFAKPCLDLFLDLVLDWLEDTDYGLGEVIDRLQHLYACRHLNEIIPGGLQERINPNHKRMLLPETVAKIKFLRSKRVAYRDIAKMLEVSVGVAYKYANQHYGSSPEQYIKTMANDDGREWKEVPDHA